ncbi:MAG: PAS domain-containing protein [Planctomycetales bacterium]|nr:PAS domain-containing protein [Planctomycetales bacterium]
MARPNVNPTGREQTFDVDEIIVSKTDTKGIITYANTVFMRVSGYKEDELLGAPHNLIRHPDMPRCVFKLLWDTIESGKEIFAYVVNLCKNGDHYWVLAHVTPSFDSSGRIVGYHSSRRVPDRTAVEQVIPIYRALCEVERSYSDRSEGMEAATQQLVAKLGELNMQYDEFVFSLATCN